jgi:4'-phosphopantetheinyl transferase
VTLESVAPITPVTRALVVDGCAIAVSETRLSGERSAIDSLTAVLSVDERARVSATSSPAARERFIVSRGRLRTILGASLACAPASVALTVDACGKPSTAAMHFNVAHAGDVVLFACADREVGIDVEWLGRRFDPQRLSARCLTSRERDAWLRLDAVERGVAFLRLWVRKEACVKASGEGLRLPIGHIDVTDDVVTYAPPDTGPASSSRARAWRVRDLAIDADYVAAVAVAHDTL